MAPNNMDRSIRIRKFNESANMEEYELNRSTQQIISRDLIEDYFSLLEDTCNIEIELYVISKSKHGELEYSDYLYYADGYQIAWRIDLLKKINEDFYIEHGDSCDYYFGANGVDHLVKILDTIKSINRKIEPHNHSISVDTGCQFCYVTNNENENK